MRTVLALLAVIALPGCKEERVAAHASAPEARQQEARVAADASLQSRLRGQGLHQRGVQVFSQALPETVAVCGRAILGGAPGSPYVPYVAVVSFEGEAPRVANLVLGATGPEASRVFVEMVDRCFDGGGPATQRVMARNFPPLPAPTVAAEPGVVAAVAEVRPAPTRPAGTVTISSRGPGNLRSAAVGGEVIRTLPPLSTLQVLGEAPGGWYQVGQAGRAIGWVHASVLEMPAR